MIEQPNVLEPVPPSKARPPAPTTPKHASVWTKCLLASAVLLAAGGVLALGVVLPKWLFLLAFLVAIMLACRQWICWQVPWRSKLLVLVGGVSVLLVAAGVGGYVYVIHRYQVAEVMKVPILEYGHSQYPEDPAHWSIHYGNYNGRTLTLVQKDATHFDFVLEPLYPFIARIEIRDVDVSLMTPGLPDWVKEDDGLRRIALTDRQWNRQEVRFDVRSPHITITGGDGFEKEHIYSV